MSDPQSNDPRPGVPQSPPPLPPGQGPIDPRGVLRPGRAGVAGGPPPSGPWGHPGAWGPPPRSGGGGWKVGLVICLVILGVSLLLNLLLVVGIVAAGAGSDTRGGVTRETVQPGDRTQTVAVVPIEGVILDDTEQQVARALEAAAKDGARALVLHVNSPGGTVTDSDQIYRRIRAFAGEKGIPVVASFDATAASGGYYVACAAERIFAEATTITGSIGVLLQYPDLAGFAEKTGISLRTQVASDSPNKNLLDPFGRPTAEQERIVQGLLDGMHGQFRQVVLEGRGEALASAGVSLEEVADGSIYLGARAAELGLVDEVGSLEDAVAWVSASVGLSNPRVMRYKPPPTLIQALGLAGVEAGVGQKLTLPPGDSAEARRWATRLLHELSSARVLYLYRGV